MHGGGWPERSQDGPREHGPVAAPASSLRVMRIAPASSTGNPGFGWLSIPKGPATEPRVDSGRGELALAVAALPRDGSGGVPERLRVGLAASLYQADGLANRGMPRSGGARRRASWGLDEWIRTQRKTEVDEDLASGVRHRRASLRQDLHVLPKGLPGGNQLDGRGSDWGRDRLWA